MSQRIEGLRHIVVPEFVFGEGARHTLPVFLRNFDARRPLLVSDPGVVDAGWVAGAVEDLEGATIPPVLYQDVTTNPGATQVAAGADLYLSEHCDAIVAVGGGSVIDCAKAIGIVVSHGRDILEFAGVDALDQATPPLVCVSTTTTSADVSQFAIISDSVRHDKLAIISRMLVPDVSLLDPVVYTTLPRHLTSLCGIDSLSQALEAFVSNAHSPFTDLHALDAFTRVWNVLPRVHDCPDDLECRSELMFGNLEGGIAFSNASLGLVHAMAHAVGGLTDAHHGACIAAVLPTVVAFNHPVACERFDCLAEGVGILPGGDREDRCAALVDAIIALEERIGARVTLSELGVRADDIPPLVTKTLNDPTLLTNPREATASDVEALYERAL